MKFLTVKELIEYLSKEDPSAVMALDCRPYITLMINEGFMEPGVYVKKGPHDQKEYFLEDEIKESEKNQYIKVVILNAL